MTSVGVLVAPAWQPSRRACDQRSSNTAGRGWHDENVAAGRKLLRGGAALAGAAGAAGVLASAAGSIGAASYLARRLLTPERQRTDNCLILAIDDPEPGTIVLDVTEETILPGRYGIWTDSGRGHLRVGEILRIDLPEGRVTRRLESVDVGEARPGPARWNGFYYGQRPDLSLGLPTTDVLVRTDIGQLPAWLVPAAAGTEALEGIRNRWAVCLHGRGGTREECLRVVPVLHRLDITTLISCYRNDEGAPPSPDGRYNLGLSEWRDAEAAVRFAVERGASEVILVGWSMGAAISLQMLDRSPLASHVGALVFDGPVIDWGNVIAHHARLARVPQPLTDLTRALMGARWARRLVGVHEPLDVADTNWQHRSGELRHRMLIIHSLEDDFVPAGPATALAAARPDLVRFEPWPASAHTKEWNTDPQRWEAVVTDFLSPPATDP